DGETDGAEPPEADDGTAEEGARPPDFRDALRLMVGRMSQLIVKRDKADPERVPAEHDDVRALREILLARIDAFPDLPFSPIDEVRDRVEAAGRHLHERGEIPAPWVMDEISARGMKVERGSYVPMPARDRNTVIAGFNGGRIDGLVVTRAGSTGLSLHASEKVADRRPRLMVEHQIPANVVERVQFWGRVNRRGQVVEPGFATLSTGLPMQARPLAMQNKKVADLSANVSGSADNATAMDVPDILDDIGNEIARNLLEERPSLAERMCIAMKVDPEAADAELYFVNKILQRLVLLPSDEQDALFAEMLDLYGDRERELAAIGRHPHGSRELEGAWRVVEREVFAGADARDGEVFGRPVYLTTIETLRQTKPLRRADVSAAVEEANQRLGAGARAERRYGLFEEDVLHLKRMREQFLEHALPRRFQSVEHALRAQGPNSVKIADARAKRFREILAYVRPGLSLSAPDEDGRQTTGVVVDVRRPSNDEMHLPGRWTVRYVLPGDEKPREISIATLVREQNYNLNEPLPGRPLERGWPNFDALPGGRVKVERKILDGNLVAAVRAAAESAEGTFGSAVAFRGEDGIRRKGVLIPKSKQNRLQNLPGSTSEPRVALAVLRAGGRLDSTAASDKSQAVSMMVEGRSLVIQLPGGRNRKAAKAYLASEAFLAAVSGAPSRDDGGFREYRLPLDA
ncbi:strawberry notch C-terminal domain-containing protein, partial [Methylobacterium hispanicum]